MPSLDWSLPIVLAELDRQRALIAATQAERGETMSDDPATDPVGTVRIFPRWQDEHHERQYAIRWYTPLSRDEKYPWLLLDSDGPQRLDNDAVTGCERISMVQLEAEFGHAEAAAQPQAPITAEDVRAAEEAAIDAGRIRPSSDRHAFVADYLNRGRR